MEDAVIVMMQRSFTFHDLEVTITYSHWNIIVFMQTPNLIQQISTSQEARNDTYALTMTTYPTYIKKTSINVPNPYHGHHLACHWGRAIGGLMGIWAWPQEVGITWDTNSNAQVQHLRTTHVQSWRKKRKITPVSKYRREVEPFGLPILNSYTWVQLFRIARGSIQPGAWMVGYIGGYEGG